MKPLDLITIGRSSVDLYGDQIGGRLEDMGSFSKYIGGSPTNIACGTARLGLRSAVITGVGDEHMGRFIREQLVREGVDVRGVKTDPARLMHQRLCGWIDPSKSGRVGLDTLCGYIWPDEATNPNTLKTRRQTARKALAELAAVGWTLNEYAKGKWEIKRPAQP